MYTVLRSTGGTSDSPSAADVHVRVNTCMHVGRGRAGIFGSARDKLCPDQNTLHSALMSIQAKSTRVLTAVHWFQGLGLGCRGLFLGT